MTDSTEQIDVLVATHQPDLTGGGELALLETIKYLKDQGVSVHVITSSEGDFSEALSKLDISYSIIFLPFWAHGGEDPSDFIINSQNPAVNMLLQIVTLIRTIKPKLCISNTIVMPWLAYASSITKTPHAWMVHELSSGGLNLRYALGEEQTLRNIGELTDLILFNSHYTEQHYLPFLPKEIKRGIVYPGGKPFDPQSIDSPFDRGDNLTKLVIVSQVKPQKGQIDAVRALIELHGRGKKVQLVLVGLIEDDAYKAEMEDALKEHSLQDSVKFVGFKDNPASYLQFADIVIMTATNEAFGRATVEGMLAGKPVIGAASAATPEIITDRDTGLLYEPGDAIGLANVVEYLIDNPSEANRISESGKNFAKKQFLDQDVRFAQLMQYYHSLPSPKTSLDLSLLGGSFEDFQRTADSLAATRERVEHLENRLRVINSLLPIRIYHRLQRVIKR